MCAVLWAELVLQRVIERAREEEGVVRNFAFIIIIIIIIIIITGDTLSLAALEIPRQCPLVHHVKAGDNVERWAV